MKVLVDGHRCQAAGLCVAVAPEVFDIGDDGVAHTMVDEVAEALLPDVEEAVTACPMAALALGSGDGA